MSVSSFLVIIINIGFDENITCTFNVHARDILRIHDAETDLVVFIGLWSDIP